MGDLGPAAGAYGKMLEDVIRGDRLQSQRLAAHRRISEEARQKVVRSYRMRKPRRNFPPYRQGRGRIGYGLVEAALLDGAHQAKTTRSSIVILDFDVMDRMTKGIWRQINFGAMPNPGTKKPGAYPVVAVSGGYSSGAVFQVANRPIPAGVLRRPRGRWKNLEGRFVPPVINGDDRFVPFYKSRAVVPLRGSRATQFFDSGVAHVAKSIGPAYVEMLDRALADPKSRSRLKAGGVRVPRNLGNVKRPQFFSYTVKAQLR